MPTRWTMRWSTCHPSRACTRRRATAGGAADGGRQVAGGTGGRAASGDVTGGRAASGDVTGVGAASGGVTGGGTAQQGTRGGGRRVAGSVGHGRCDLTRPPMRAERLPRRRCRTVRAAYAVYQTTKDKTEQNKPTHNIDDVKAENTECHCHCHILLIMIMHNPIKPCSQLMCAEPSPAHMVWNGDHFKLTPFGGQTIIKIS
jgi:hypothetical protein